MAEHKLDENWNVISVKEMNDFYLEVMKFVKASGRPFMNVFWLRDLILSRLMSDKDFMYVVEGERGNGKSNLNLVLALLQMMYSGVWQNRETKQVYHSLPRKRPLPYPWEQMTCDFSFDKCLSFLDSADDIKQKFNALPRYGALVLDESSRTLHKYQWQSDISMQLIQMTDMNRFQNKSIGFCIPNFKELNSTFRNDRIRMRLYVVTRGQCIISIKDVNRHVDDPWHTEDNARDFENKVKRVPAIMRDAALISRAERSLKGYCGQFLFPNVKAIAPRIWGIYSHYKTEHAKAELAGKEDDKLLKEKRLLKWQYATWKTLNFLSEKFPDMDIKDLSRACGVSSIALKKLLKTKFVTKDGIAISCNTNLVGADDLEITNEKEAAQDMRELEHETNIMREIINEKRVIRQT